MKVLILEDERGAAAEAVARLEQAGHEISRCHDPDAGAFPCRGMGDGLECPLDAEQVDVAVVVRREARSEPTAGEDGARCALRRHIPLVVAGEVAETPYADWAAVVRPGTEELAEAVREAASAPLRRHSEAARRSLRAVLEHHGLDATGADATVERTGSDLLVTLYPGVEVDQKEAEMASVRSVGAVRDIDPYPRVIDVTIVTA